MRKQALKNRNRQRTKAAKYRKQVERRATVKATSNEERRKAQADRNVFTSDDDWFLADTSTSAMGLDSWLTEILTLVENSFDAGEVSRFAAMFFNSGGKRVTAIQGDNDIPSSWKKWCRTKEKRRCYAFVGTVFTG